MTLTNLFLGFGLNLLVALLIVRGIYYPARQDKNFIFTYLAFNTVIYFVMTFLTSAELSIGVGFGLFAIFSVLRYRTAEMSIREMTYLFILIALPVMNSVLMGSSAWLLLASSNLAIVAVIYVLERGWGFRYEITQTVKFDRVDLIRPEQREHLIEELRRRTGLPVSRVEVGRINYLDDSAELTIYYTPEALPASRSVAQTEPAALRTAAVPVPVKSN